MATREELQLLSDAFRSVTSELPPSDLVELERTLQVAFSIKNLRNVQLWTRRGTQQRNILTTKSSPLELEMRLTFVNSFLNQLPSTSPQKAKPLDRSIDYNGRKLREYLADDYVRGNMTRIYFDANSLIIEYNADSNTSDGVDDEITEEFEDFLID